VLSGPQGGLVCVECCSFTFPLVHIAQGQIFLCGSGGKKDRQNHRGISAGATVGIWDDHHAVLLVRRHGT